MSEDVKELQRQIIRLRGDLECAFYANRARTAWTRAR